MKRNCRPTRSAQVATVLALSSFVLSGCGDTEASPPNVLPSGITEIGVTTYSATTVGAGTTAATQDLLTAGLGKTGLGAAAAPAYADPLNPTALELRRNGIYANYRAILDFSANGGYGSLYGPNVDIAGNATSSEGLIPGQEYIATLDDGTGRKRVVIAVQIPDSFNKASPCIILGPSSGSRGFYGAVGTAGEWGLKRGCAVALTDAGKGVGLYDMTDDSVNKIDGTRATRTAAGALNFFAANITDAARAAYNLLFPNRLALKQVHSQLNPEKDWGTDTLASASYALYAINKRYGDINTPRPFTAANTIVIAGSASNGGAAVLHAAEQDTDGLIDGVVAAEPVTQLNSVTGFGVQLGGVAVGGYGKSLGDMVTYANLYQPCAALAAPALIAEASFFNFIAVAGYTARATARCDGLAAKGLVAGADTAARSLDALNKLRNFGWTTDHDQMHSSHYGAGNAPILAMMYPVGYGRFSVTDNVCNASLAQADATGSPIAVNATSKATSFAIANGTANNAPASVIYNDSVGGAKRWEFAVSPSTGVADFGLDNALCQRALVTGVDSVTGAALTTATMPTLAQSVAVRAGMAEVTITGNLRAVPTIIVSGRSDALVPVNNNSRAYVAKNKVAEGAASKLSYIEVTNAQHFDTFIPQFSGYDTRFVPLHPYFVRSMDAMYAYLKSGAALPPSQVVRTTPRGGTAGAAPAITVANVPAISAAPVAANAIVFSGTSINVPN